MEQKDATHLRYVPVAIRNGPSEDNKRIKNVSYGGKVDSGACSVTK